MASCAEGSLKPALTSSSAQKVFIASISSFLPENPGKLDGNQADKVPLCFKAGSTASNSQLSGLVRPLCVSCWQNSVATLIAFLSCCIPHLLDVKTFFD